jgi:hypothetical protein
MTTNAAPTDDDMKTATQLAIIIVVVALMLNVLFYFLSGIYYDDKRASQGLMSEITGATVSSTRFAFGIFSGLTAATLAGTMFAPKWVGHGIAAVLGLAPLALGVSLVVIGFLYPALVVLSLIRTSRGAWAFLCALCWVLGVVMLFGAPKIRSQINIGLWTAMIIPAMLTVAGIGLTMIRRDYRDA